jgi:hypothetical protein
VRVGDTNLRETIEVWKAIAKTNEVKFRWVKAHSTCEGNNTADKLAKEGATLPQPTSYLLKPVKAASKEIKESTKRHWARDWKSKPDYCRQPKQWMGIHDEKKVTQLLKLKKPVLSRAIQLMTGFNNMNNHTARKFFVKDLELAKCRLCKTGVEDAWHLATQCTAIRSKVEDIFDPRESWTVDQLVAFLEIPEVAHLMAVRHADTD